MADQNRKEWKVESGLEFAQQLADKERGFVSDAKGLRMQVTLLVGIAWSLFQLSIASVLIVDSVVTRAIHLAFAMFMLFLNIPFMKSKVAGLNFLNKTSIFDILLGLLAALSALYIIYDREGMAIRMGAPLLLDKILGIALVLLLLEGARRIIGPALPVIAAAFIAYSFFGPYMPDVIAFKGVSLNRFLGQITMTTEGIYGIPLDVSAKIVFLFVLFGSMLERAGAGLYFIKLALGLLGSFRGGPAKAAILGSGLTGMVSGASIANVVTTGTFTIPLMKRVGYPPTKAAAIEVAASIDGQLAPPIMGAAAFIIAEYCNVPYLAVVKAAIIPAFASYATLFFISHVEACKLGMKGIPRRELPPIFRTLVQGLHYLIPLAVLLYELIVLRHTPELAAFNAIAILIAIMLVQHPVAALRKGEPVLPALKRGAVDVVMSLGLGARNMVGVAMATAAAGISGGGGSLGLGGLITQLIAVLSQGNIILMLIVTAIASLIIGMGLPTTATYIVMASLTAPAILHLAAVQDFVVPLMAAHLFCFFFGILADDTPPVGLAAYAAAAIANAPPIPTGIQGFMYDIRTAILPFMFIFNHDLILHNVDSWGLGILIYVAACIGNCAFASATQGWLIARNRFYEIPLLLGVMVIMLRPDLTARLVGLPHEMRYLVCLGGAALMGLVLLMQHMRSRTGEAVQLAKS